MAWYLILIASGLVILARQWRAVRIAGLPLRSLFAGPGLSWGPAAGGLVALVWGLAGVLGRVTSGEALRAVIHDPGSALVVVVNDSAGGVAVAHQGWYRTPDGPWTRYGPPPAAARDATGSYTYDLPPLPTGSVVRMVFTASGGATGAAVRVHFQVMQNGQVLSSPDPAFAETVIMGDDGGKDWAWRYELR